MIEGFSGSFLAVVSHSSDSNLSLATKPWIALEESLKDLKGKGPDQAAASFSFWKTCQTCQLPSNFDMMLISSSFYRYWEHCIVRFTFETYWHDVRYHDIGSRKMLESCIMAQDGMAAGDFRTLPASAWHGIHARFEAHAIQLF